MIVDEKHFHLPPPPYPNRPLSQSSRGLTLCSLPAHLLLQVVLSTFPLKDGLFEGDSKQELERQNLHWIHSSLRFVNRALYLACMNVLRSAYLPVYDYNIRVPYSSDPFPSIASSSASTLSTQHRELHTLDLFIALLAHEDVLIDASTLHLPREEAYKDLFDLMQPRSRLEDLVAEQGRKLGVINVDDNEVYSSPPTPIYPPTSSITKSEYPTNRDSNPYSFSPPPSAISITLTRPPTMVLAAAATSLPKSRSSSFLSSLIPKSLKGKSKAKADPYTPPSPRQSQKIHPLPFSSVSIAFSPRKVGLVYTPPTPSSHNGSTVTGLANRAGPSTGRKRTLVEVTRAKEDSLELTARRLVKNLKLWLEEDVGY